MSDKVIADAIMPRETIISVKYVMVASDIVFINGISKMPSRRHIAHSDTSKLRGNPINLL